MNALIPGDLIMVTDLEILKLETLFAFPVSTDLYCMVPERELVWKI